MFGRIAQRLCVHHDPDQRAVGRGAQVDLAGIAGHHVTDLAALSVDQQRTLSLDERGDAHRSG
ncbi:hypothetical protein D9M72_618310 [compost metagenome]